MPALFEVGADIVRGAFTWERGSTNQFDAPVLLCSSEPNIASKPRSSRVATNMLLLVILVAGVRNWLRYLLLIITVLICLPIEILNRSC